MCCSFVGHDLFLLYPHHSVAKDKPTRFNPITLNKQHVSKQTYLQMDEEPSCCSLPVELQKNLVTFLNHRDASRFSRCSKHIHANLSLSFFSLSVPLILNATWHGDVENGDIPKLVRSLPLPFCNRVHSVIIRARWVDQGWGNRKGQVYIIAKRSNQPNRIVFESTIAEHDETDLRLYFNPIESETYHIFQKSGGGGGHLLNVKDMTAHLVIFDISDKRIARNFEALAQEGALKDGTPFHFNVLKATTQALRTQVESDIAPDVHLVQLFKSIGISIDIVSLGALIEICDAFLGNSSELLSHHLSRNPCSERGNGGEGRRGQRRRRRVV